MKEYEVITFYKYIGIGKPEKFMDVLRKWCVELNIFGRIFLGPEGINAGACGTRDSIRELKDRIEAIRGFSDLKYRTYYEDENVYHKLIIRVRPEIITLGTDTNIKNKGRSVSPTELKNMLDNNEDVVLLDARNDFEVSVGKFKDALTLPIKLFSEFPKAMKDYEALKNEKIILYCTGGIRCEKGSAYLKDQGFEDVSQLDGGIINFVQQYPGTYFDGELFVFDDRLVADTGSGKKLGVCKFCKEKTNNYVDCDNLDCNGLFICCVDCQSKMKNACSTLCTKASNRLSGKDYGISAKLISAYFKMRRRMVKR